MRLGPVPVRNVNRTVGGIMSGEIARKHGPAGLPEGTIEVSFSGSAGQSFGAWLAPGVTFSLRGETNDYTGKGISGGIISVRPPETALFRAEENMIVGNTVLYGATAGRAFFRGLAGERFAVRNSGAWAVVEGVGDHGCEYMTGGRVVVLGPTGRNFAAGMSGGIAYVYDVDRRFAGRCNPELVEHEELTDEDADEVKALITEHAQRTGSLVARNVLASWERRARALRQGDAARLQAGAASEQRRARRGQPPERGQRLAPRPAVAGEPDQHRRPGPKRPPALGELGERLERRRLGQPVERGAATQHPWARASSSERVGEAAGPQHDQSRRRTGRCPSSRCTSSYARLGTERMQPIDVELAGHRRAGDAVQALTFSSLSPAEAVVELEQPLGLGKAGLTAGQLERLAERRRRARRGRWPPARRAAGRDDRPCGGLVRASGTGPGAGRDGRAAARRAPDRAAPSSRKRLAVVIQRHDPRRPGRARPRPSAPSRSCSSTATGPSGSRWRSTAPA